MIAGSDFADKELEALERGDLRIELENGFDEKRIVQWLRARGIDSLEDVPARVTDLKCRERIELACLARHSGRRVGVDILLALLRDADQRVSIVAAACLASLGGGGALSGACEALQTADQPHVREAAALALATMKDERALAPLLEAAAKKDEHADVRAQALEGVGIQLSGADRRTQQFKQAAAGVAELLEDAGAQVRFWACYALGAMRAKAALPALRQHVREDNAVCPGWWTVREQARDAIVAIESGRWPAIPHERAAGSS